MIKRIVKWLLTGPRKLSPERELPEFRPFTVTVDSNEGRTRIHQRTEAEIVLLDKIAPRPRKPVVWRYQDRHDLHDLLGNFLDSEELVYAVPEEQRVYETIA